VHDPLDFSRRIKKNPKLAEALDAMLRWGR
jgi:hypothetical protein